MKETLEIRVNYDFAHLLFKEEEGRNLGDSIKVIEISTKDPRYLQIPIVDKRIEKKYNKGFFYGWQIKRKYSKTELDSARLLHLKIKKYFEPTGEECGTLYDESVACEICGSNRKQMSSLILRKGTIPRKDIASTIGGEIVVSSRFAEAVKQRKLKGIILAPVKFRKSISDYYQLFASEKLELSPNAIVGADPFDLDTTESKGSTLTISGGYVIEFEKEVYKCPKGDLIGLNLISEPYVLDNPLIKEYDFFTSRQNIGVKRGYLQPEPIYFCSQAFRKMIEEEKLTGFKFEVAHVE